MRFVQAILFALLLSSCGEEAAHLTRDSTELRVLIRQGEVTYQQDDKGQGSGFEHDLLQMLARDLGLKINFLLADSDADILRRLKAGEADLAAGWQTASDDPRIGSSELFFNSQNILVSHEASLPPASLEQLEDRTVHVIAGSRQEAALRALQSTLPQLTVVAHPKLRELDLLEGVAQGRMELALVNNAEFDIGKNYYPELQAALPIGERKPIVWLFEPRTEESQIARVNAFLTTVTKNGELNRLQDRYFGHVNRLNSLDTAFFIQNMRDTLPQYRALFESAQVRTGIDWRLLAALAYQESKWMPLVTSPTGVRGIMMLTENTADHYGVSNRLDPAQSIMAGATYLNELRQALPANLHELDRLWLALAAYNLGQGHLNAARSIAKAQGANPDAWYEMKKILPLLAQPQYYQKLKSGKGRGGEAVILVENIRVYYGILTRYEHAYNPLHHLPQPVSKKPPAKSTQGLSIPTSSLNLETSTGRSSILAIPDEHKR